MFWIETFILIGNTEKNVLIDFRIFFLNILLVINFFSEELSICSNFVFILNTSKRFFYYCNLWSSLSSEYWKYATIYVCREFVFQEYFFILKCLSSLSSRKQMQIITCLYKFSIDTVRIRVRSFHIKNKRCSWCVRIRRISINKCINLSDALCTHNIHVKRKWKWTLYTYIFFYKPFQHMAATAAMRL